MNSAGELKSRGGSDVVDLEVTEKHGGCEGGGLTDLTSGSLGVGENGRGNG